MDPVPPNNASLDCRLSFFHAEMNCDSRVLKASLSILTSSAMTAALKEVVVGESELKKEES